MDPELLQYAAGLAAALTYPALAPISAAPAQGKTAEDEILRSLGIVPATPFNWGDEPRANLDPIPSGQSTLSGLDSLRQFVHETSNDDPDLKVKQILASLLKDANVDLTPPSITNETSSKRKRYFDILDEDGEISSRDVSIRGLSDRACAELTCESRSSLFGSILRLFDMSEEDKKAANALALAATSSAPAASGGATEGADTGQSAANESAPVSKATPATTTATPKKDEAPQIPLTHNNPILASIPVLSTPEIVRSCHLTASPGDIPPSMDSKEYTMAALHFLSSNVPLISEGDYGENSGESLEGWKIVRDTFPILPLLMAINPEESLEKRVYARVKPLIQLGETERKQSPDSMDSNPDFRRRVLNLERAFTSSLPFSRTICNRPKQSKKDEDLPLAFQRYVPRRKLCPRIETEGVKEELTFMISGHVQQETQSQAKSK